ncbi:hypothetical protein RND81_13G062100 [Saponaria officinalis]|uniref:Uncharacterized protein n=1 Tax=Saponaria officinalis TaxID=3572 RepID=A0AAW1GUI6_SAPOF
MRDFIQLFLSLILGSKHNQTLTSHQSPRSFHILQRRHFSHYAFHHDPQLRRFSHHDSRPIPHHFTCLLLSISICGLLVILCILTLSDHFEVLLLLISLFQLLLMVVIML